VGLQKHYERFRALLFVFLRMAEFLGHVGKLAVKAPSSYSASVARRLGAGLPVADGSKEPPGRPLITVDWSVAKKGRQKWASRPARG
jgi:hypothetical protein